MAQERNSECKMGKAEVKQRTEDREQMTESRRWKTESISLTFTRARPLAKKVASLSIEET
jgi:hypothetical protein